jgi:predicted transcriptional regulator
MLGMAKKKPRTDRHLKRIATFRLSDEILEALKKLAEENRRTMTTELTIALENHLAKFKLWPPKGR